MRITAILLVVAALAPQPLRAAEAAAPEFVTVRAVSWDPAWKPSTEKEWLDRAVAEVESAAKDGVDAVVFPDNFLSGLSAYAPKRADRVRFATVRAAGALLPALKAAARPGTLIVLGSSPHQEDGWKHAVHRVWTLSQDAWLSFDRLDLTPAEYTAAPPGKPGMRFPLFRFRGGLAAAVPGYSLQKPELAVSMKKRGVALVLVPAAAEDEISATRVLRTASGRAVELGAAVVVAAPGGSTVYLPAQKGFEAEAGAGAAHEGRTDHRLPWGRLLKLREPSKSEARPFIDPTPHFQTEI